MHQYSSTSISSFNYSSLSRLVNLVLNMWPSILVWKKYEKKLT